MLAPVPQYPKGATLIHSSGSSNKLTGAALFTAADGNQAYGIRTDHGGGGADGDSWDNGVMLRAGTYTVSVLFLRLTSNGIVDIYVDGTNVGSVDLYGSSANNAWGTISNVVVKFDGFHAVKCVTNGKNASSSGYRAPITAILFKPASYS